MKLLWYTVLFMILVFLSVQLGKLFLQTRALKGELAEITAKTAPLAKENEDVRRRIEMLKDDGHLELEFRRAGYAAPGEKVFIIIPPR